ncbi:ATP-binding protein [Streptomyces sp. NA02950]|uniref:ATP-binding protein n=1 Tax=Streptomyces sp. NA02950 TaxID=2742137 RepID=UPI001590CEBB|nr:ATP-binding protein [Streptomyces sp. NA02950]QKV93314.1 ATP-binding protein [Streptomyces sp. NA02950]QKV94194.1 ATP-binding protein [Streptomyces sp. NA02950]
MDWKQAWSTTTNTTNAALDSLAPVCVPFAARWDLEADRRDKLRTPEHLKALMAAQKEHNAARSTHATAKSQQLSARAASKNPFAAGRRAARVASKAALRHERDTRAKLKAARVNYPSTLKARAIQAHSVHAMPSAVASALMSTSHLTVWPVATSAVLIGANVAGLALGRRRLRVPVDESLSLEERQLMERLDPSYWVEHAPDRGLSGTVTTPPAMEPGGIRCEIRLDGTWTVKTLADKADSVRALLGARTALRIRITSASRGGWAVLTLATRSAAAGVSSLWTPDRIPSDLMMMSLGLDTETGDEVLIPFDERLLVSGASGTGKSWSFRPLMATAHLRGDLLLIDGKGEEANIWESACRVAVERDDITDAVDEAHAEMTRRKVDMKKRGISVWDGRQLTVVVDEGQVILALITKDKDRLQRLIELSSLGRSRGVVLWWATQYPLTDGGAPGVHKLIAPNLLTRFSLRVAGTTQAQVALDDCAHYAPHQIPDGREYRGHGYLKGYGPRMLRTWTLDDAGVRALPKSIWTPKQTPGDSSPRTPLHLVKETAAPSGAATNRDKVLAAVQSGARTAKDIAEATGLNKGTVSREIKALTAGGALHRTADGRLLPGQQAA